jgi:Asp/Glu/hydantoin racemase
VTELADTAATLARMTEIGATLRDRDGADVVIMGCAGMAAYRTPLETALGLPVVEPCQAATAMALGRIRLNQSHRPGD